MGCVYLEPLKKCHQDKPNAETFHEIKNRGGRNVSKKKLGKRKSQVLLQGYVDATTTEAEEDESLTRAKSLTDDDLEELKGCLDLGFGFSYDEIPELCNTLPALELCYSMSQKFLDDKQNHHKWKISSPGDNPEEVKARLKYWAQAVACTVRLCS